MTRPATGEVPSTPAVALDTSYNAALDLLERNLVGPKSDRIYLMA